MSNTLSRPSAASRWAQETFSRESILAGIKTLIWLAPLTLLIWVYAERSQLADSPTPETIPIEVRSSDPKHFAVKLMLPENDRSIVAQLRGPQARIEQVRKEIALQDNNPSVVLTINTTQAGVIDLGAVRELSLNRIFAEKAVSVFNCKPSTLKVVIDELVEDEAEVKVRTEQQEIASAVFTPPTVKLSAPKNDVNDAKSRGPLVVYADFDKSALQVPGSHEDITVRLQSDQLGGSNVTFTPGSVKATIVVRQSEVTKDLKSIPIQYRIAPDITNNYQVQITGGVKVLPAVPITGPKDKVDELVNASQLKAYAVLPILKVSTEAQSAIPEIYLPDPLVRVDSSYTPKEISYTLVKRDQP